MWQESVPQVQWEGWVNRREPGYKLLLKGPDGAFISLASISVRRHQLLSDIIDGEVIL
jgi:hypothetical protein